MIVYLKVCYGPQYQRLSATCNFQKKIIAKNSPSHPLGTDEIISHFSIPNKKITKISCTQKNQSTVLQVCDQYAPQTLR